MTLGSGDSNVYDHAVHSGGNTRISAEPQLYNTLSRTQEKKTTKGNNGNYEATAPEIGQNNVYDVGVRSKKKVASVNVNEDFGGFGGEYESVASPPPANNIYDAGVRSSK